jgi:hypothetical protein
MFIILALLQCVDTAIRWTDWYRELMIEAAKAKNRKALGTNVKRFRGRGSKDMKMAELLKKRAVAPRAGARIETPRR